MDVLRFLKTLCVCTVVASACLAQANDAAAQLPDGEGKQTVIRMCTKCHGPAVFRKVKMGRLAWEDEVAAMVERGAVGTEEEIKTVVDYMAKNFGRDSKANAAPKEKEKINVNKATARQLETSLELSAKDAAAIVQFREKNGDFQQWQDLQKVPGLDAKSLEEKKARIVF